MPPRRRKKKTSALRGVLITAVVALALLLWLLDRGLPAPVVRRLERKLSEGPFSYRFEHASFNLWDGIVVRNARIHVKHGIGPPLVKVDELRLRLRVFRDRPFYLWVSGVTAHGFVCQPFEDLPTTGDSTPLAEWKALQKAWAEPIHLTFFDSSIFSVAFRRLDADFFIRDGALVLDNIRLTLQSRGLEEVLEGRVRYSVESSTVYGRLAGTLTPEVIEEVTTFLGGEGAVEYYHYMDGYTAPLRVNGELTWKAGGDGPDDYSTQDMRLSVHGEDLECNGVPLQRFRLGLQWLVSPPDAAGHQLRRLTLAPIHCVTAEGRGDFAVAWYPREHATDFTAKSTLPIWDLSKIIDIPFPPMFTNFVFQAPPSGELSGRIYGGDLSTSSYLKGTLSSGPVRIYGFDFQNLRGDVDVEGFRDVHIRKIGADTSYGGSVTGRLDLAFSDDNDDIGFDVEARLHDIDFGRIRHHLILGEAERPGGQVNASLTLRGIADTNRLDTFSGNVTGSIRNSMIFRIPIFAGLTDFLGRNVPGVDLLFMQSSADLKAAATNGLVTIERFNVEGNLLSMVADGKWRLNKEGHPVEGIARIRLFKQRTLAGRLARILIWPVNKMMELRVSGPVADPSWSYIGLIDRIKEATFWAAEDATALDPEETTPEEPMADWEREGEEEIPQ